MNVRYEDLAGDAVTTYKKEPMNKIHPSNWEDWDTTFQKVLSEMTRLSQNSRFQSEDWFDVLKKIMKVHSTYDNVHDKTQNDKSVIEDYYVCIYDDKHYNEATKKMEV